MPGHLLRKAAKGLAGRVDQALVAGAITPSRRARHRDSAESLTHAQRMQSLAVLEAFYGDPRWLAQDSGFFPPPASVVPEIRRVRRLGRTGEVLELRWQSEFEPLWHNPFVYETLGQMPQDVPLGTAQLTPPQLIQVLEQIGPLARVDFRDRYLAHADNRTAYARHYRHYDGPRPTVALVHGYMSGYFTLEERVLQAERFFDGGMDVVLTVLPLHGARRDRMRGIRPPRFPGSDPRYTVEGFRQAVFDHRALFDYLMDGQILSLGMGGMSLGGYTTALMATVEPRLSFALMRVPLGCIADFARHTGRMVGTTAEQQAQTDALRNVHRAISPLARAPMVPESRVHIITGAADRVTGPDHSQQLVTHFGATETAFAGGHVLQFDQDRALLPFFDMLHAAGLWNAR